ncbi:MAG TPA: hypothetical protein VNI01_05105 [Elusimicrobiota bacterium]|jgi:hypothetical protein|nr:hypothetical protein [Elusimicrobiota bacterium]
MNRSLVMSAVFAAALASAATVRAESKWNKEHPRRHEVNKRGRNENRRVNKDVKDGRLTRDQAGQLKGEEKAIRQEERADAARNGGHITKAEQRRLNKDENQLNKDIHADVKANAGGSAAPATTAPAASQ